jgi:hypothetical protein
MADENPVVPSSRVAIRAVLIHSEVHHSIEVDGVELARKRDLARAKQIAQELAEVLKSSGVIRVIEMQSAASIK